MDAIEQEQGKEYFGVKELADAAERILSTDVRTQEKGTVADYPNERTIRFYISRGLLPATNVRRGSALVFGYHHLLALIAIKQLQADGVPINLIGQIISGKSERELEELLDQRRAASAQPWEERVKNVRSVINTIEEIQEKMGRFDVSSAPKAAAGLELAKDRVEAMRNRAKGYLESLLSSKPSVPPEPPPAPTRTSFAAPAGLPMASPPPESRKTNSWHREEVAPGLELHIREDFEKPSGFREMSRLIAAIKQILRR